MKAGEHTCFYWCKDSELICLHGRFIYSIAEWNPPAPHPARPLCCAIDCHGLNIHQSGAEAPYNVAQPVTAMPCRPGGEALHTGTQQRAGNQPKGARPCPYLLAHPMGRAAPPRTQMHSTKRAAKSPRGRPWAADGCGGAGLPGASYTSSSMMAGVK